MVREGSRHYNRSKHATHNSLMFILYSPKESGNQSNENPKELKVRPVNTEGLG